MHAGLVTVNGVEHELELEPSELLVYVLRERLGLTGTNVGCDTSSCGACTVLLDGESVKAARCSASRPTGARSRRSRASPERLAAPRPAGVQEHHALQCGYCTPGFVLATVSLLREHPNPDEQEIRHLLEGNLCRCTGYHNIVRAVQPAAEGVRT